jgi:hypothetical protein
MPLLRLHDHRRKSKDLIWGLSRKSSVLQQSLVIPGAPQIFRQQWFGLTEVAHQLREPNRRMASRQLLCRNGGRQRCCCIPCHADARSKQREICAPGKRAADGDKMPRAPLSKATAPRLDSAHDRLRQELWLRTPPIIRKRDLADELACIRTNRIATCHDEQAHGVYSIAAAITHPGRLTATRHQRHSSTGEPHCQADDQALRETRQGRGRAYIAMCIPGQFGTHAWYPRGGRYHLSPTNPCQNQLICRDYA